MINNQIRREEFNKRRNYKGNQSFCEGYECPIFQNCLVEINQFKNEKQQLIKFLEDKIKNYEEDIENSKPYLEHKELFQQVQNDIHTSKCIITNLKDVLDFVNKGGKDE